jgi:phage-related protein
MTKNAPYEKELIWIASSLSDLRDLPKSVQASFGYALYEAQLGSKPRSAKPLKGFGGASVLEILGDDTSGTYRAVYTVRFKDVIYVLHVFQKKSKSGIGTPKQEIELVKSRLITAEDDYKSRSS